MTTSTSSTSRTTINTPTDTGLSLDAHPRSHDIGIRLDARLDNAVAWLRDRRAQRERTGPALPTAKGRTYGSIAHYDELLSSLYRAHRSAIP